MEVKQFVAICLILIAVIAIAVFVINIAWNLAEWITSAVVIVITMIGSAVVTVIAIIGSAVLSAVLLVGSIIVGAFSWIVLGVVSVIVGLIVYIKKKCRKDK